MPQHPETSSFYFPQNRRQQYELLRSQLVNERASFIPHWRELSDFILPRRPRFVVTDVNRGERRSQKIIDSTATLAARTLSSGMMAGVTSPARPWFRLTTPDPGLAEFGPVKSWLHVVTERMLTVFLRSNLYNALPVLYQDIGVFATSAMSIEEDFDDVLRFYVFPVGSYMITNDDKLQVRSFVREFRMTVRQMVERFAKKDERGRVTDWSNFSQHVRSQSESGQAESWIDVVHVILPNDEFDPRKLDAKFKRYRSVYYENGYSSASASRYIRGEDDDRVLRDSGFDLFPILAPRWEVTGEDVYGTNCPGMTALGDIKQLQLGEKRGAQAIEKMVNPPMTGPTALRTQKASILPGDITYVDVREGQQGFRPAHEVNPRIQELEAKQAQIRQRIRRSFYEDLFLMLANLDRREITAREIEERHEEKLLALGPVLEQLNQDLLDPLIDNAFDIMLRQGFIPEPPDEIAGMTLKVEYISIMAQAQKLIGLAGVERFAQFTGAVAAQSGHPEVIDKVDLDQMIDVYAERTGVPPSIVRSDDAVLAIRQARAQAQQEAAQMQAVREAGKIAKDFARADMSKENALTRLLKEAETGQLVRTA